MVAIGFNGRQSRLYTLNASATADELPAFKETLQAVAASFKAPAAAA